MDKDLYKYYFDQEVMQYSVLNWMPLNSLKKAPLSCGGDDHEFVHFW